VEAIVMSNQLMVRRVLDNDRPAIKEFLKEYWGDSRLINTHSDHEGSNLPGYIIYMEGFIVGLLTFCIEEEGDSCEITSINSTLSGRGIGSMLMRSLEDFAAQEGIKRIWAITTNDNLQALGFYQKRGYVMKRIYENSVTHLRLRKPSIPTVGNNGIMILSEVEVEKRIRQN
jgi:DNA-3-methyladenine glycosylase I